MRYWTENRERFDADTSLLVYQGRGIVERFAGYLCSAVDTLTADRSRYAGTERKEIYMYAAAYEQEKFGEMLDYALEKAGIIKNPSFEVIMPRIGELCLATDHPRRTALEELLNADRSLPDTFQRIVRHYACITKVVHGRDSLDSSFSIKVSNDGYRICSH